MINVKTVLWAARHPDNISVMSREILRYDWWKGVTKAAKGAVIGRTIQSEQWVAESEQNR